MKLANPVLQKVYDNVVRPAMRDIRYTVEGHITHVDYHSQTADVSWREPDNMRTKESKKVPLPKDADGVFKEAPQIGDKVTMSFRNGDVLSPYISLVHKRAPQSNDYRSSFGSGIPKGISYF